MFIIDIEHCKWMHWGSFACPIRVNRAHPSYRPVVNTMVGTEVLGAMIPRYIPGAQIFRVHSVHSHLSNPGSTRDFYVLAYR